MLKHPAGYHNHELTKNERVALALAEDITPPLDLNKKTDLRRLVSIATQALINSAMIIQNLRADAADQARKLALAEQALKDMTGIRLEDLYAPQKKPPSIHPDPTPKSTRRRPQSPVTNH